MSKLILWMLIIKSIDFVYGRGLLILYRPRDITNDCAFSSYLRYDITFGAGLSDTLTLVFRTMIDFNYECIVEISVDSKEAHLIMVIRFPNTVKRNCQQNWDSFVVLKKEKCIRICDVLEGQDYLNTPYFVTQSKGKFRFRFASNSSINADMNALIYQVTATAARKTSQQCLAKNETICKVDGSYYCYTSGVVCDGIKNCGVSDWFDERLGDCEMSQNTMGVAALLAVLSLIVCVVMAGSHILMRCLPPLASSFFIFNANEDNRLCIDSVYEMPERTSFDVDKNRKYSLIPISSSSSSDNTSEKKESTLQDLNKVPSKSSLHEATDEPSRRLTMKSMTARLQQTLRSVMKQTNENESNMEPPGLVLDLKN